MASMLTKLEDLLCKNCDFVGQERAIQISEIVMCWLSDMPLEGYIRERYEAGDYSRRNVEALCADIEDDA